MPSKERVSAAQLKVGILGLVALFFVTLLIFLLTGSTKWFQHRVLLHVYVADAAGLTPGSPVRINGIAAGKVDTVQLSGLTNPQRIIKVDFDIDQDLVALGRARQGEGPLLLAGAGDVGACAAGARHGGDGNRVGGVRHAPTVLEGTG